MCIWIGHGGGRWRRMGVLGKAGSLCRVAVKKLLAVMKHILGR
jgi:hypothetical protein